MKIHKNLLMLQEVASGLGPLKKDFVFVGGATTVLYFDDSSIPGSTPSDDVDLVVEVTSRLGFSNPWYPEAISEKIKVLLPNKSEIFIFSLPYFLATKLAAYRSRGGDDLRRSQDMEDIVTVFAGNSRTLELVKTCPENVKKFIKGEFEKLTTEADLLKEAADGFLRGLGSPSKGSERVVELAKEIARFSVR